jgi:hypothetical protein
MMKLIYPMTKKKIREATVGKLTMKQVLDVCAQLMAGASASRELLKIQCSSGNWDTDPYMHGMANGMILVISTVLGEDPEFLDAPERWKGTDVIAVTNRYADEVSMKNMSFLPSGAVKTRLREFKKQMTRLNLFVQEIKKTLEGED